MSQTPKGNMPTVAGAAGRIFTGATLGDYKIGPQLGRGGMGEVWKARDTVGNRDVVIKVLPPELQGNKTEMDRVKLNFGRIQGLQHESICPTYVLGHDPGAGYYLVMKLIEGIELKEYFHRKGKLSATETVQILGPIARALDYAHKQKIVHRDVKTENIMVRTDGSDPQLLDFGVASEIRTSLAGAVGVRMDVSGTRPYMAPEQWEGSYQDGKSDQYALAVVAYELMAGRLPFAGTDVEVLRQCVLNQTPSLIPGLPPSVNNALQKGLAKKRDARFANCADFINALEQGGTGTHAVVTGGAKTPQSRRATTRGGSITTLSGGSATAPPPPPPPSNPVLRVIQDIAFNVEQMCRVSPANRSTFWMIVSVVAFILLLLIVGFIVSASASSDGKPRRWHIGVSETRAMELSQKQVSSPKRGGLSPLDFHTSSRHINAG